MKNSLIVIFILTVMVFSSIPTIWEVSGVPNTKSIPIQPRWSDDNWSKNCRVYGYDIIGPTPLPGFPNGANPRKATKIIIEVEAKFGQKIDRATFNCTYTMWSGKSGYYWLELNRSTDTQMYGHLGVRYTKGSQTWDTRMLTVAGTSVKWWVCVWNNTGSYKGALLSPKYYFTTQGMWSSHNFDDNIWLNYTPKSPMIGDNVDITVTSKNSSVLLNTTNLDITITEPGKPSFSWRQSFLPPQREAIQKTTRVPKENHTIPGTYAEFRVIVWVHGGHGYWMSLQSPTQHYAVSDVGSFPYPGGTFADNCIIEAVTTNPPITIVLPSPVTVEINAMQPVNVTVRTKYVEGKPNATLKKATIYYMIEYEKMPPACGFDQMIQVNQTARYFVIPGIEPHPEKVIVRFKIEAWDLAKNKKVSDNQTYAIKQTIGDHGREDEDIFYIRVYDDRRESPVNRYLDPPKGANVTIRGEAFELHTWTNDFGYAWPHFPGNPSQIEWLPTNKTYLINVTYRAIGMSKEVQYFLDPKPRDETTTLLGGKGYNFSVILIVKNGTRTIEFRFNFKPIKHIAWAKTRDFPDWPEYLTYLGVCIMLAPLIILFDRRRKKAEEEEKRVTL